MNARYLLPFALAALAQPLAANHLGVWSETDDLGASVTEHTVTPLLSGKVLVAGGRNGTLARATAFLWDPATRTFEATGQLNTARFRHTATLLPSGKVLVAGGLETNEIVLASAEVYDPATGSFEATGPLAAARYQQTATLLPSGKVLVAGGACCDRDVGSPLDTAELYDPASGTWEPAANMASDRFRHTATLLPSGQVMVAGGDASGEDDPSVSLDSVEFYTPGGPGDDSWEEVSSCPLLKARFHHTATLLTSGLVLIAGGESAESVFVPEAELYDPASCPSALSVLTDSFDRPGARHVAALLPSGRVLKAGGQRSHPAGGQTQSGWAEIYDPAATAWEPAAGEAHSYGTLLPSGKVLAAGGNGVASNRTARIFDPLAMVARPDAMATPPDPTATPPAPMERPRAKHTATLLPDGRVLVAGGCGGLPQAQNSCGSTNIIAPDPNFLASVEIYDRGAHGETGTWEVSPDAAGDCPAAPDQDNPCALATERAEHTATLLADGRVLIAGGHRLGDPGQLEFLARVEIYDPATGLWCSSSATTCPEGWDPEMDPPDSLNVSRSHHTATLLPDGRVLVAGGSTTGSTATDTTPPYAYPGEQLDSAEVFDPATGEWTQVEDLAGADPRAGHTATLLPSGRVLLAGGFKRVGDNVDMLPSAEIYDPATGLRAHAASMLDQVARHTATLLPSGRVLLAGGLGSLHATGQISTAQLYDPAADAWEFATDLAFARDPHDPDSPVRTHYGKRAFHTATLLPSGQALLSAGVKPVDSDPNDPDSVEYLGEYLDVYHPATDTWTRFPPFPGLRTPGGDEEPRGFHTATLLPSGEVLVAGGMPPICDNELFPGLGCGNWHAYKSTLLVDPGIPDPDVRGRPKITPPPSSPWQIDYVSPVQVTGFGFGGDSEAGGGAWESSATNFPLIQLRSLEGELVSWLEPDSLPVFCPDNPDPLATHPLGFCDDQEATLTVARIPPIFNPGWHLLMVFAAGVASESQPVLFACDMTVGAPADQEAAVGSTATFGPVLSRGGRSFQWQQCLDDAVACGAETSCSGTGGEACFNDADCPAGDTCQTPWSDLPGATGTSYTTPLITGPESGTRFRVLADGGCTRKASPEAVLTVEDDEPPEAAVVSPSGGEYWLLSDPGGTPNTEVVTWSMSDNIRVCGARASLWYSDDGGATYLEAPPDCPDPPDPADPRCQVPEENRLPRDFGSGAGCVQPVSTTSVTYAVPEQPPSGVSGSLYKIQVEVTDHLGLTSGVDCPGPGCVHVRSPSPFFIVQPNDDSVKTLILAHTARMQAKMGLSDLEKAALDTKLQELAEHPRVQGRVLDLGGVTSLSDPDPDNGLYAAWDAGTASANDVLFAAGGIHEYLRGLLADTFTGVRYLVLAGDDRIIPMARLPDRTTLLPESSYVDDDGTDGFTGVTSSSVPGRVLAADRYLSDDPLAVRDEVLPSHLDLRGRLFLPDLAAGRLVEEPAEMITTIATFISQDGILDLAADENRDHQVLVTGYDFLVDSAGTIDRRWRGALVPQAGEVNGALVGRVWPGGDPRQAFLDHLGGEVGGCGMECARFGVMSLSGHASHFEAGVPGVDRFDLTGLEACAIETNNLACSTVPPPLDLAGSVVYAVGCHSGLPVPGSDPLDDDNSLDLPQTFLGRGVLAYAGNTGYGYGLVHGIAYGERLVEILTEHLAVADATTAVGDAFVATKLQYHQEIQALDAYDLKSLMQWTFYGLPMVALHTPPAPAGGRGGDRASQGPLAGPSPAPEDLAAEERLGDVAVRRQLSGAGAAGPAAVPARAPLPPYLTRLDLHFDLSAPGVYSKRTAAGEICCPDGACPGGGTCPGSECPAGFTWCPTGGCADPDGCYYTLNGLVERASSVVDRPLQPYLLFDSRLAGTSQHGVLWKGGAYFEESGWKPVFAQVASNEPVDAQADDPGVLPQVSTICPNSASWVPGEDPDQCRPSDTEVSSLVINAGEAVDSDDGDGRLEYDLERHYGEIDVEAFYFNNTLDLVGNCDRVGPSFLDGPFDGGYHQITGTTLEWEVPASDGDCPDCGEVWRVVVVWDDGTERCGTPPALKRCWTPIDLEDSGADGTFTGSAVVAAESRVNYLVQAVDTRGNVSALPFEITDPDGEPCRCGDEPAGLPACPEPTGDEPPICADSGVAPQEPRVIGVDVPPVADLSIEKAASPDPVTAGTILTYTLTVANAGPSDAENVVVTDILPAGVAYQAAGGDGWSCAVIAGVVTCRREEAGIGSVPPIELTTFVEPWVADARTNTASVASDTAEASLADNAASVTTAVATAADLALTLAAPPTVLAGGELVYAVTVDNLGPSDAAGVQVSAILPPELSGAVTAGCDNDPGGFPVCDLGTVAAGSPATYALTATVDPGATGDLVTSATAGAAVTDPLLSNNTALATTAVDLVAPTVLGTGSIDDTGDGVLEDCESTRARIRHLLLAFSEAMQDGAGDDGADDVTNPENYRLLAAGPDRDFTTSDCGPPLGDDRQIPIAAVAWDEATLTATLDVAGTGLAGDLYRLLACGSTTLRDLAGHPLDGDADGTAGGDFSLTFRVDRENLFANGRFDCNLDGWTAASTAPGEIAHRPDDADDSSVSGSSRFTNLSGGTAYALGQCLPAGDANLTLTARWRLDAPPLVSLRVTQGCEHYSQPLCAGPAISSSTIQTDLGDTGGLWQELEHLVAPLAGAVSALCSFDALRHGDVDFQLFLDDAVLSGEIFADGFESGDVSPWSASAGE